jgi:G3E family GTPase
MSNHVFIDDLNTKLTFINSMKEKEGVKIPVTILSGFLGAGKTTFLNDILLKNKETRYAIIENEFGDQGIDNELVLRPDETIVELNSGCLCCTLNDNLYDILNELYERRSEFDEIIIEATGVADPTGLAEPFIVHPLIKKHFPLRAIICLVDAELVEDQLTDTEEAINQITFSDILLINKVDLVSEEYVTVLEGRLRQLNPLATIVKGHKDQFPKIDFCRNHDKLEEVLLHSQKNLTHSSEQSNFPVQKPHSHHHHKHTEEVNSHTFVFDTPFDLRQLQLQLSVYLTFQAKQLYRMKGLVWLENEDQQFILQSVGKKLQRQGLERMLKICLSKTKIETEKVGF